MESIIFRKFHITPYTRQMIILYLKKIAKQWLCSSQKRLSRLGIEPKTSAKLIFYYKFYLIEYIIINYACFFNMTTPIYLIYVLCIVTKLLLKQIKYIFKHIKWCIPVPVSKVVSSESWVERRRCASAALSNGTYIWNATDCQPTIYS